MLTDERTGRNDEANNYFLQFCESAKNTRENTWQSCASIAFKPMVITYDFNA